MSQNCRQRNTSVIKTLLSNTLKILIDIPFYIYLFVSSVFISLYQLFNKRKRKDLDNETILITGAASGIGQNVAIKFATMSRKAVYILWDINESGLLETAKKCRELGALNVHTYVVDLSNHDDVVKTANLVRTQVGVVTTLFNNAGLTMHMLFQDSNFETEEKIFRVNLMSQMWTIREFLPDMIKKGSGHLVSTCSGTVFKSFPYITPYIASKHGLRGFMETLKMEMEIHPEKPRIRFTLIYPGWVKTNMTSNYTWEPRYQLNYLRQMSLEYVSEKMVEGILREEEQVFIPNALKFLPCILGCSPANFISRVQNHLFRNIRIEPNSQCNENRNEVTRLITNHDESILF